MDDRRPGLSLSFYSETTRTVRRQSEKEQGVIRRNMMNTETTGELFFLYTMVNDPISYNSNDKTRVVAEPVEVTTDPLAWLFNALDWLNSRTLRASRALPSA
jgi:hypothetical protein